MAISYSSEWIVGWIARAGDATEAQFRRLLPGLEPVDATPFPSPALTFGDQPTVQATMTEDFSGGLLAWRGVDPHTGAVTLETTLFEPGGLSYFFGGDATLTAERPSDHVAAGGLLTYQFHVTPRDMYPLLSVGAEGFTVESASVNGQPCRIGTRVVCYPGATPQVPFTATIVLRALPVPEGRVTAWLFAIDLNPADNSIDERVTVDAPRGRAIRR